MQHSPSYLSYGATNDLPPQTDPPSDEVCIPGSYLKDGTCVPVANGNGTNPNAKSLLETYRESPLVKLKMITGPLALGIGYYRTKSIWKALLLGFVSTPYLVYVAYDMYQEKK